MTFEVHHTGTNWEGDAAFSQVVTVPADHSLVVTAGQVAYDDDAEIVGVGDIEAQTRKAFENLDRALMSAGASMDDVLKLRYSITERKYYESVKEVRERVVYEIFNNVDHEFAVRAAEGIGVEPPEEPGPHHQDHDKSSPALSQENTVMDTIESRQIAVLVNDGFNDEHVEKITSMLEDQDAQTTVVSKVLGERTGANDKELMADENHATTESIEYDAIFVPGGSDNVEALKEQSADRHFIAEAFKHKKSIGAIGDGIELLETVDLPDIDVLGDGDGLIVENGVVTSRSADDVDRFFDAFSDAIAEHRHWERSETGVRA